MPYKGVTLTIIGYWRPLPDDSYFTKRFLWETDEYLAVGKFLFIAKIDTWEGEMPVYPKNAYKL